MCIPLALFTILGLANVNMNLTVEFLNKYFWPLTIGLGSYFLIYGMHVNKNKERHDRILATLPLDIKFRTTYKFVFGVLPIVLIILYLELLRTILPAETHRTITRIDAQLSLLFIFLGIMSTSVDYLRCPTNKKGRSLKSAMIVIVLALSSALFIILVGSEIIPPIIQGRDEIYFYLWGFVMAVVASVIYYRRTSFI
jgi:hypothetical protein